MFEHNISPIIFSIGPLAIRWYSLAYLLGFVIVYYVLKKKPEFTRIKGWKPELTDSLITWLFFGMLIGARFFHVFVFTWADGTHYFTQFWTTIVGIPFPRILAVWEGGLSFHGAIIGMAFSLWRFTKKHKLSFYNVADFLAIPGALFLGFGRIANFINAEMVGRITSVSWCVNFPTADGCRHPTQLYEAIKNFFIFGGLMWLRSFKLPAGIIFWSWISAYGLLRFILMFFRDETIVFLGLTLSQIFSGIMFVVGLYFIFKILGENQYKAKKTKK